MNYSDPKKYLRGPDERDGRSDTPTVDSHHSIPTGMSRRQFLEAAGFTMSLAVVSGCGRAPTETALPFAVQPEGLVPGRTRSFASTCAGCAAGCGLLVSVRDGRPLKMEGAPGHPISGGGLCAIGQALPLGLYDSHRLTHPLAAGKEADWDAIDKSITAALSQRGNEGAVVLVTPTVTSPTLQAVIDSFMESFDDGRHVQLDSVSSSAILDAHQQTHGTRVLPRFRFNRAKVIVSLGADFLGTWISPVEFTTAWASGRVPTPEHPQMSYHVHLEGRMSLTGSNADRRYRLAPQEYAAVLSLLAVDIGKRANQALPEGKLPAISPLPEADMIDLGKRLWHARGESLIVCDSQDIAVQQLVNYINNALGNYGNTLDVTSPSRQRQGSDADVKALVDDLKAGKVSTLLVAGVDLTHNLPDRQSLVEAISKVPLVISLSERVDDFASLAHFVCPDHHPLESWLDAEAVTGVVSLSQPMLEPLGKTRSILESLNRWSGGSAAAYDIVKASWQEQILPRAKSQPRFQTFWDQAVHDGYVEVEPDSSRTGGFRYDKIAFPEVDASWEGFALTLYSKVGLTDSRHAHNPWLQELPDPVTKVTWDNYVCIPKVVAQEYGLTDGDIVRVKVPHGASVELPVFVQPGQHDRVLAIALGYGVRGTDRFTDIGPQWLESRPTVEKGELVGKRCRTYGISRWGTTIHSIECDVGETLRAAGISIDPGISFVRSTSKYRATWCRSARYRSRSNLSRFCEQSKCGRPGAASSK